MQNSVEIFSIALGLVEPWYVKEVVFCQMLMLARSFIALGITSRCLARFGIKYALIFG